MDSQGFNWKSIPYCLLSAASEASPRCWVFLLFLTTPFVQSCPVFAPQFPLCFLVNTLTTDKKILLSELVGKEISQKAQNQMNLAKQFFMQKEFVKNQCGVGSIQVPRWLLSFILNIYGDASASSHWRSPLQPYEVVQSCCLIIRAVRELFCVLGCQRIVLCLGTSEENRAVSCYQGHQRIVLCLAVIRIIKLV